MSKVLVIGSEGFIGNHLHHHFKERGWLTHGVDVVKNRLNNSFVVIQGEGYDEIFRRGAYDICLNAGGNGSVPISIENPLFNFDSNVRSTLQLLESIRKYNPNCKLINFSSAAVYGNPKKLPISEGDVISPLSPYGWSKYSSENLCIQYYRLYGIASVNLRLFSVFGVGLKKQLFWDLYQKTKLSSDIPLFGTGNETRDFISIQDVMFAIDSVISNSGFQADMYNIASGKETTIKSAATIFLKSIADNFELQFNNVQRPGDPLNWRANISKIIDCGFSVNTNLENELSKMAQWLKENH
jgi:UDP-glucose 4-epimerase